MWRDRSENRAVHPGTSENRWLPMVLVGGIAIRLALVPVVPVGTGDLSFFWKTWMAYAADHGLIMLYSQNEFMVNYPPVVPALFYIFGSLDKFIQPMAGGLQTWLLFAKLPAFVADLAIVLLLKRLVDHMQGISPSVPFWFIAALWFLNPAVFYLSGIWGQVDALHSAFLLACLICALERRWVLAGVLLGLALLTKLQSIVLCPLLFLIAVRHSLGAALRGGLATIGVLIGGLAPFALNGATAAVEAYMHAAGLYPRLSVGADNLWSLIGYLMQRSSGSIPYDTVPVIGSISYFHIGLGLFCSYVLMILALFLRRVGDEASSRTRAEQILMCAGLMYLGFYMLPTQIHERYLFPALCFLVLPALRDRFLHLLYIAISGSTALTFLLIEPPTNQLITTIASLIEPWKIHLALSAFNVVLFCGVSFYWFAGWRSSRHAMWRGFPPQLQG